MSEGDAQELTDTIRRTGEIMWSQMVRAFNGRAWVALGYSSWDDYCLNEFDGARIKMPREERREVVASLRDAGMSMRAIAAATGDSTRTVQKDIGEVSQSTTPADSDLTPPHGIERPEVDPDDVIVDAEIVESDEVASHVCDTCGDTFSMRDAAINRRCRRLEMFASSWHEFRGLRDLADRDEVLRRLADPDRGLILAAEKEIAWKT